MLDPEDLHHLVREYQATTAAVIDRLDGHIAQYLGDGVLVYFGFPRAHEDDARRAVQAGLAVVKAISQLSDRVENEHGHPLAVRVGIHTGLVVTGEIGAGDRREQLALGPVPNIAARLQGIAEPNTVVLSSVTHGLVQGFFSCQSMGLRHLKGISRSMEVFRAIQESAITSRFELAVSRGLSPMVGRQDEMSLLLESFRYARETKGRVVFIEGEAGIGKSRLMHCLRERLESECGWRTCYGSPLDSNRALFPLVSLTRKLLQFEKNDSTKAKRVKLEEALKSCDLSVEETAPLLAAFLSVPVEGCYPPLELSPELQRERTLETLLSLLIPQDHEPPMVLLVEDLHWLDPSTLEFLKLLIDRVASERVLVLLTARPAFRPRWGFRAHLVELQLERIGVKDIELLVTELTGGRKLPETILRHLVEKTDGVPLFVEEITKSVLESGLLTPRNGHFVLTEPLRPLEIPTTLQGSLIARLDRLGRAKEVAQIAAAIGRRFSFELLSEVSPFDEEGLENELGRLVDAQLVRRKTPSSNRAIFIFNHALIRDAAYDSLLAKEQRRLHREIAVVLERRMYGPSTSEVPTSREAAHWPKEEQDDAILAYHWSRVIDPRRPDPGLVHKAVGYLQRAGGHQLQLSAYEEASRLLREALNLTGLLPEGPERDQGELDLQIALSTAIRPLEGWDSPVLMATCQRARELCGRIGTAVQLAPVLYALWADRLLQLDLDRAYNFACELQDLADQVEEPMIALQANLTKGQVHFWRADFIRCRQNTDHAHRLLDEDGVQHEYMKLFGHEPLTMVYMFVICSRWLLGDVTQAEAAQAELLDFSETLDHPFSLAIAVQAVAWARYHAADPDSTRLHAQRLISICDANDFPFYRGAGHMFHGWAVAVGGDPAAGISEMRSGYEEWIGTFGGKQAHILYCLQQAEGHLVAGDRAAGLRFVNEGLETAHHHQAHLYVAEFYRIRGELLGGRSPEAEAAFRDALETARKQQAKMFELRAALRLARLLKARNEAALAQQVVTDAVGELSLPTASPELEEVRTILVNG